MRTLPWCVTPL